MAVSLGVAAGVGDIAEEHYSLSERAVQLLMGFVTSLLAVPAIIFLRTKRDRRPLSGLGIPDLQSSIRTFGLGVGITFAAAVTVGSIAYVLGGMTIVGVDWPTLLGWLAITAVFGFFYEALPEELTLRGYTFTNLNAKLTAGHAAAVSLVLFCFVPVGANAMRWIVTSASNIEGQAFRITPEGETAVVYFSMLLAFGYALHVARLATGSIWTGVGLHLAFLLINRQINSGTDRDTGLIIEVSMSSLILPAYLTLTIIAFSIMAHVRGAPINWQHIDAPSGPASPERRATIGSRQAT